jgi:hypothetical protein
LDIKNDGLVQIFWVLVIISCVGVWGGVILEIEGRKEKGGRSFKLLAVSRCGGVFYAASCFLRDI